MVADGNIPSATKKFLSQSNFGIPVEHIPTRGSCSENAGSRALALSAADGAAIAKWHPDPNR
jgi:hypothetical protein